MLITLALYLSGMLVMLFAGYLIGQVDQYRRWFDASPVWFTVPIAVFAFGMYLLLIALP